MVEQWAVGSGIWNEASVATGRAVSMEPNRKMIVRLVEALLGGAVNYQRVS